MAQATACSSVDPLGTLPAKIRMTGASSSAARSIQRSTSRDLLVALRAGGQAEVVADGRAGDVQAEREGVELESIRGNRL